MGPLRNQSGVGERWKQPLAILAFDLEILDNWVKAHCGPLLPARCVCARVRVCIGVYRYTSVSDCVCQCVRVSVLHVSVCRSPIAT